VFDFSYNFFTTCIIYYIIVRQHTSFNIILKDKISSFVSSEKYFV